MKHVELQSLARSRGLAIYGCKKDVVKRILDHYKKVFMKQHKSIKKQTSVVEEEGGPALNFGISKEVMNMDRKAMSPNVIKAPCLKNNVFEEFDKLSQLNTLPDGVNSNLVLTHADEILYGVLKRYYFASFTHTTFFS